MTQYVLADESGNTLVGFEPATDALLFPSSFSPRFVTLSASEAGAKVAIGGYEVTLAGLAPADLDGTQFVFTNAAFRIGSTGDDYLVAAVTNDVVDITAGGSDTVLAGDGYDII